jgi:hypothetical protein
VLGAHLISNGSMSNHVIVPASGTVQFPTNEMVAKGLFRFDLIESELIKERLNAVSMDSWMLRIDDTQYRSAADFRGQPHTREDLGFFNMVLLKLPAYGDMLAHLGRSEGQSVDKIDLGHVGEQDSIFNIVRGLE